MLDFSPEVTGPMLQQGKKDAIDALDLGPEDVPKHIRDSKFSDFTADQ